MSTKQLAYIEQIATRLGEMVVQPEDIIEFPAGIFPFTEVKRFMLVAEPDVAPFIWLVAVDEPELAFVVVRPEDVIGSFELDVQQVDELELAEYDDALVLALVVVGADPADTTVNLLAPLVINPHLQIGRQIILEDDIEMARYPWGLQLTDLSQSTVAGWQQKPAA